MAKFDIYEAVTERFIEQLEKGVIPWKKPWYGASNLAFNRVSKKPYSLLNQLSLKHSGEYATFKQWSDLGGKIKKGEKSEMVVFWKRVSKTENNDDGEEVVDSFYVLRYFNVFHISQVEGVEPLNEEELNMEIKSIPDADDLISDYVNRSGITFEEKLSDRSFYSPMFDTVVVPKKEQFKEVSEYYSTTFHELTHSTGAKSRLNRIEDSKNASFGSEDYSKEELVAEIGSATILSILGIESSSTFNNSAAYISSWLEVLKSDKKFIVSASAKAKHAVNYIFNDTIVE